MTDRERAPSAPVSERVLRPLVERLDEANDDLADAAAYAQAEQDALIAARSCAPTLSAAEHAMLTELGTWRAARRTARTPSSPRCATGWIRSCRRPVSR
ncbi:MAG: hypothetical protein ACRDQJ_13750, partial [Pseudonocardiaceae bacterium]